MMVFGMNTLFSNGNRKLNLVALALATTISFPSLASEQSITDGQKLTGKKVFAHYNLNDDIPKLAMSSLLQGEHLVEHATRRVQVGEEVHESTVFMVKDTDTKGNIDLRIKYNPNELDEHEDVISEIENFTRAEYRLRNYAESYDSSSVVADEQDDGTVIIGFDYSKYGLPQDIAYFRFLSVEMTIKNGVPVAMRIFNRTPFAMDKYQVDSYEQYIELTSLPSGKVVIAHKHTEVSGSKKNRPVSLVTSIKPVAIYEDESGVNVFDQQLLDQVSDPRMREEGVEIDRTFPLMGDLVRRQGIDLPLPFGISAAYRNQSMDIPFTDFVIQGVGLNDLFDPFGSIGVVNAESFTLRGDVNILPFWNVFGLVGKINVDANVDAEYTGEAGEYIRDKLNNKLPHLGDAFCKEVSVLCNSGRVNVPLHLEYDLAGVGTTLSVGYREFFASVTGSYTKTRLKGTDNWGDGIVTIQPMLGYQLVDYRAQLFVGAEYQGLDSRMEGHVVAGDIEFDYDIGVNLDNWAYLVGFNKQLGKNYNLSALYNRGETRSAVTLNFGYRF